MKLWVVGTGNVGSLFLQYILPEEVVTELYVINRNYDYSEGLMMDTASAFPRDAAKLRLGSYDLLEEMDVIVYTAGAVMEPGDGPHDMVSKNKAIVDDIFGWKTLKEDAMVIVVPTQVDVIAQYVQQVTGHDPLKVVWFGGTLDVNRLRCLIAKEIGRWALAFDAYFVWEHGARGISVFEEDLVENGDAIHEATTWYFGTVLSKMGTSTSFGPARALADLVRDVMTMNYQSHCVSVWFEEHGLYLTWPCCVTMNGVENKLKISLSDDQKQKFDALVEIKKKESK